MKLTLYPVTFLLIITALLGCKKENPTGAVGGAAGSPLVPALVKYHFYGSEPDTLVYDALGRKKTVHSWDGYKVFDYHENFVVKHQYYYGSSTVFNDTSFLNSNGLIEKSWWGEFMTYDSNLKLKKVVDGDEEINYKWKGDDLESSERIDKWSYGKNVEKLTYSYYSELDTRNFGSGPLGYSASKKQHLISKIDWISTDYDQYGNVLDSQSGTTFYSYTYNSKNQIISEIQTGSNNNNSSTAKYVYYD